MDINRYRNAQFFHLPLSLSLWKMDIPRKWLGSRFDEPNKNVKKLAFFFLWCSFMTKEFMAGIFLLT